MKKINTIFYLLSIAVFNQTVAMDDQLDETKKPINHENAIIKYTNSNIKEIVKMEEGNYTPQSLEKPVLYYKGLKLTTTKIKKEDGNIAYKINADCSTNLQRLTFFAHNVYLNGDKKWYFYFPLIALDINDILSYSMPKHFINYFHDDNNTGHIYLESDNYFNCSSPILDNANYYLVGEELIKIAKKRLEKNKKMKTVLIDNTLDFYRDIFNKVFCDYKKIKNTTDKDSQSSKMAYKKED